MGCYVGLSLTLDSVLDVSVQHKDREMGLSVTEVYSLIFYILTCGLLPWEFIVLGLSPSNHGYLKCGFS